MQYLISRHPRDEKNLYLSIFKPFDKLSWLALAICLISLTLGLTIVIRFYRKNCPWRIKSNWFEMKIYFIKIIFGFTEPEGKDPFSSISYLSTSMTNVKQFCSCFIKKNSCS